MVACLYEMFPLLYFILTLPCSGAENLKGEIWNVPLITVREIVMRAQPRQWGEERRRQWGHVLLGPSYLRLADT